MFEKCSSPQRSVLLDDAVVCCSERDDRKREEREKGEQHATKVPSHCGTTFFAGRPSVFLPKPFVSAAPLRQQCCCLSERGLSDVGR